MTPFTHSSTWVAPFRDAPWVFAPNFGDERTGEQGTSSMLCPERPKFGLGWVLPLCLFILHPPGGAAQSSPAPLPARGIFPFVCFPASLKASF